MQRQPHSHPSRKTALTGWLLIKSITGLIYGPSRVRYPMVRLDWYRKRHLSDTSQRGDNRFVRVGWDEALDLF
jgi:trimethylamine-N-oxide reductase (cytochrome c)